MTLHLPPPWFDLGNTYGINFSPPVFLVLLPRHLKKVMDYFSVAAGGNAAGGKHPGSGGVGLCSRERFKQLLRGLWRTHFDDGQADSLADRYLLSAGQACSGKARP